MTCVAFSPDDQRLASGSNRGSINISDAESGKFLCACRGRHTEYVFGLAFSPDGKRVASVALTAFAGPMER